MHVFLSERSRAILRLLTRDSLERNPSFSKTVENLLLLAAKRKRISEKDIQKEIDAENAE